MKLYVRSAFDDNMNFVAVIDSKGYEDYSSIIPILNAEIDRYNSIFDRVESLPPEEYEQIENNNEDYKKFVDTFQKYYEYIDRMEEALDSDEFIVDENNNHNVDNSITVRNRIFTYEDLIDILSELKECRINFEDEVK